MMLKLGICVAVVLFVICSIVLSNLFFNDGEI